MKYFSMFSGIGGFELGIQQAYQNTWECVGYSEIDKYAIKIYERHFNHKNYGDATKIDTRELPDFDLLVGGFPCQAFSVAGKRKGFNDTRGTLFFDIARVLADKRPGHFVLENVKGLLSHDKGKTFQTILGVLTDLGYLVEWQVLNSKNFGVPQNRERVFIIGHFGGKCRRKVFPIGKSHTVFYWAKHGEQEKWSGISSTIDARYGALRNNGETYLHYIGGITGKKDKRSFSQGQRVYETNGISSTLVGNAGGLGGKTGLYAVRTPLKFLQRNQKNIEGDYSFTVDGANTGGIKQGMRIRRLTPTECERLQGFPDNWTKYGSDGQIISDTQRYKVLGNAVTTNVVQAIIERLE